jgi:deoxycytidine triphosphate deaminase
MVSLSRQTIKRYNEDFGMVRRLDNKPLRVEPVSIDLHLSEVLRDDKIYRTGGVVLRPGVFCLGSTIETFNMPNDIVGFVEGKSTNAREGLQIHAAGLIDPGFKGDITLELKNLHHENFIVLEIGEPIGQVHFHRLDEPVDVPYGPGNHYQNQFGVTPSYRKQGIIDARHPNRT